MRVRQTIKKGNPTCGGGTNLKATTNHFKITAVGPNYQKAIMDNRLYLEAINIIINSWCYTPKSKQRLKWLLPNGSTGGLVVSKSLIPQP